jgi:hypothetical protein
MVKRLVAAHSAVPERLRFKTADERVEAIVTAHQRCDRIGPRCRELSTQLVRMIDGTPNDTAAWQAWTNVAHAAAAVAEAEAAARKVEALAAFVRGADAIFAQPASIRDQRGLSREVPGEERAPVAPEERHESAGTVSPTADRESPPPPVVPERPSLVEAASHPTAEAPAAPVLQMSGRAAELLWPLPGDRSDLERVLSLQSLRGRLAPLLYEAVMMTERSEERGRLDLLEGDVEVLWDEYQAYPPVGLDAAGLRALLRLAQRVRQQAKRAQRAWVAAALPALGAVALAIGGISATLAAFYAPAALILLAVVSRRAYKLSELRTRTDELCADLSQQLRVLPAGGEKPE